MSNLTNIIEGKRYVLGLDGNNGTDYDKVVCIKRVGYTASSNVTTSETRCGTKSFNGQKDRSIDCEGEVVFVPESGFSGIADVATFFEADTEIGYSIFAETPSAIDMAITGTGALISNFKLDFVQEGAATFTFTMTLSEAPSFDEES